MNILTTQSWSHNVAEGVYDQPHVLNNQPMSFTCLIKPGKENNRLSNYTV